MKTELLSKQPRPLLSGHCLRKTHSFLRSIWLHSFQLEVDAFARWNRDIGDFVLAIEKQNHVSILWHLGQPLLDEWSHLVLLLFAVFPTDGDHDGRRFHHRAFKLTVWRCRNGPLPLLRTMVEILLVAKCGIKNLIGFPDQKQSRHADRHGRYFQPGQGLHSESFFISSFRMNHRPAIAHDKWLRETSFDQTMPPRGIDGVIVHHEIFGTDRDFDPITFLDRPLSLFDRALERETAARVRRC